MSTTPHAALFRRLPSTDEVLRQPEVQALAERGGHTAVAACVRTVLERLRQEIAAARLDERSLGLALEGLTGAIERELRHSLRCSLCPVINATGVILHTNLGRAPLAVAALDHIRETAAAYSNLEFDLAAGERGRRDVHVDRLFRKLLAGAGPPTSVRNSSEIEGTAPQGLKPPSLGAPIGTAKAVPFPKPVSPEIRPASVRENDPAVSTIVVNNNAAAVLLALNSLAEGGEVIVSRGELVEIGGSFRIPDVMAKSQAILREVGTTNRTRLADYERAISDRTRLLLRVHRSNFEITGFTEQPSLEELVALARRRNLPLLEDLGSGALVDLRSVGVQSEPSVLDSLRAGVDVLTYSGDKLLGGPQAGLITGRGDLVARMRANSLFRALRVDKLTYAALEATLLAYVKQNHDAVPVWRMMRLPKDEIATRAKALVSQIKSGAGKLTLELLDGESIIGGGAAPSAALPTALIAVSHADLGAKELCARLRAAEPPVIARVEEGQVMLDLRTVFPEQDAQIASILNSLT